MKSHEEINKLLVGFVLGELSEQQTSAVKTHLAECQRCRDELKRLQSLFECTSQMGGLSVDENVCESAKQAIFEAIASKEKGPSATLKIRPVFVWRTIIKSRITKLAAAAVIIIAVLIGINHFGGPLDVAAPAFADVLEQIHKARTVTYKETFYPGEKNEFTVEEMVMEPGRIRSEMPSGTISILDFSQGRSIQLQPEQKKAIITQRVGRKRRYRPFNYLGWVRKMHEQGGEFVGQEEIEGRTTNVFIVKEPFETTTVWVNPETNLPMHIERVSFPNPDESIIMPEMSLDSTDFGADPNEREMRSICISSGRGSPRGIQKKMTIVMSDFVWDADLDESLFSLEHPEGYTVEERQFDVSERGENDLIEALAFWTEMSDSLFPSKINDFGDPNQVRPMLVEKFRKGGEPKDEFEQAMKKMNRILHGLMFVQRLKADDNWNYAGDGVRLGDADEPICWWKKEGSEDYRVIYGDLSIGDAIADDLPVIQQVQGDE